jgi:hypothetical protein
LDGFDRNPYIATFQSGRLSFLLVNVHLFFGSDAKKADIERRMLETFAIARWADERQRSKVSFTVTLLPLWIEFKTAVVPRYLTA